MNSFSKIGMLIVLGLYAELIVFGQVAMWHFHDLSSLDSMWLYAVPPIIALLGYFLKSCRENTSGGIVHDTALKEMDFLMGEDVEPNAQAVDNNA